ncbi:MAG: tryptophan-rich sensory protein [Phycisphaeraceae bacterium]|nr:tryptophan-rich sensory protein [Phycisphaeraceae bacterium]
MQNPVRYPTFVGRQIIVFIGWLVLCFAAATSAVFVSVDGWYTTLNKPSWNPPSWLFGPVWSLLYIMMAVAAWLVWRKGGWAAQRWPLSLFLVQWLLNALWTPLFFGMHQLGASLVEIVLLWLAIAATIHAFWRVSKPAGWLLVPYLAWVSFATFLNFTIWRLNG